MGGQKFGWTRVQKWHSSVYGLEPWACFVLSFLRFSMFVLSGFICPVVVGF